jgi:8-oxo-dGTP pyrophosphatase MutT (NUDIX family)
MPHIHELYDFTASGYILHPTEPKLCLHYHKKLNSWLQVGGHIELNEDPIQALHHEVEEEAGLAPDEYNILEPTNQPVMRGSKVIPLPFSISVHPFGETSHSHIDMAYILRSKTTRLTPKDDEAAQIDWFTIEQMRELYQKGEMYDSMIDIAEWIAKNYF